jgi:cytidylate kinase
MSIIVAVDGPAGSGKSSVSKEVARRLGLAYLDTGAGYRCVTWLAQHRGVDLGDEKAVCDLVGEVVDCIPLDPDDQAITLDGVDVNAAIRSAEVSQDVSTVAAYPSVRRALNEGFRRIAGEMKGVGIIIEGRDITTVVAPDAPVRVLLTASEEVRVKRRGLDTSSAENIAEMTERDRKDSAVVDFMSPAPGVTLLDTTALSFEESVQALIDTVELATRGAHDGI